MNRSHKMKSRQADRASRDQQDLSVGEYRVGVLIVSPVSDYFDRLTHHVSLRA